VANEASLLPGITRRGEIYIFSFLHILETVFSKFHSMAGHVGDGTGDPDGSRVDSLGS